MRTITLSIYLNRLQWHPLDKERSRETSGWSTETKYAAGLWRLVSVTRELSVKHVKRAKAIYLQTNVCHLIWYKAAMFGYECFVLNISNLRKEEENFLNWCNSLVNCKYVQRALQVSVCYWLFQLSVRSLPITFTDM